MTEERIHELAYDLMHHPRWPETICLLCGDPRPRYLGIFLPTERFARRIGQPKGKERIVGYALCEDCKERPPELVEQKILRDMGVQ